MVKEDQSNIFVTCADCSEKLYPNKGNFDIKVGDSVKIPFVGEDAREFMWVNVKKVAGDMFEGILDNDPVFITGIACGDKVTFAKEDVCERIRK